MAITISLLLILSVSLSYHFLHREDVVKDPIPRANIVFDRSYSQLWDIWNPGIMGYSKAAELLLDHGFNLSQNSIPLEERVISMNEGDILFLGVAPSPFSNYTESEIAEIVSFVENGGNLIVVGEHDNMFGLNDFQNKLAQRFGVFFNDDIIYTPEDMHWVTGWSDYFKLDEIGFWGSCTLSYPSSAQVLSTVEDISDNGDSRNVTTSIGLEVAEGKVVFLGDTHPLWNGKRDFGIDKGQNREFIIGIMEYLLEREISLATRYTDYDLFTGETFHLSLYTDQEAKKIDYDINGGNVSLIDGVDGKLTYEVDVERDGFIRFYIPGEPDKYVYFLKPPEGTINETRILFDTGNYGRSVDETASGLLKFAKILRDDGHFIFAGESNGHVGNYDAVILASPLKSFLEEERNVTIVPPPLRSSSRNLIDNVTEDVDKILLFGNYHTSLEAEDIGLYDSLKSEEGWIVYDYPLNDIGKRLGVEFTYFTVVDGSSDSHFSPMISYRENRSELFYSCSLNLDGDFNTIYSQEHTWGEMIPWETWELSKGPHDIDGPLPVVAWDERVFASGDISLLENQNIDDNLWFAELISKWINS